MKYYRGHLLEETVEDQDGGYKIQYNLGEVLDDFYIVKKIKSDHSYEEKILSFEEFVYDELSLEQVRDVAELLNIVLDSIESDRFLFY